ncbi:MAG: exodeoxyribonuclease V subunit gamma, partial [Chthoniobacterales bacterium]|nr:exodeoxyribonuclease V subunit gamma [Chthoniobacterales bacterium]
YRMPVMMRALEVEEASEIERWLQGSGFTRGVEEGRPGSLRYALDRMIAGEWLPLESAVEYPAEGDGGGGGFVLPVGDALRGDLELRRRFLESLMELLVALREWLGKPKVSPRVWAERLERVALELVCVSDEERVELSEVLSILLNQSEEIQLDAGAVGDWLREESAARQRRGRLSGRIAFGSFYNLHGLPCRVLGILGMGDNFPRKNLLPSWDLMRLMPKIWDRNARTEDRQLFLDALLTPTERLILTAPSRGIRTGEALPISTCVEELRQTIAGMGRELPSFVHRLTPFAPEYFAGGAGGGGANGLPRSFSVPAYEVAKAISSTSGKGVTGIGWDLPKPQDLEKKVEGLVIPQEVDLEELVRFWRNPAAGFARARDLDLPQEEDRDEGLDWNPVKLAPLQRYHLKRVVLEGLMEPEKEGYRRALLAAERGLPLGKLGEEEWKKCKEDVQGWANELLGMKLELERVSAEVRVFEETVCVKGEGWKVANCGKWVFWRAGKMKESRQNLKLAHYLKPWIVSLLLSAAGREGSFLLFSEAGKEERALFNQEMAKERLGWLVKGFLCGKLWPLAFDLEASWELIGEDFTLLGGKSGSVAFDKASKESEAFDKAAKKWRKVVEGSIYSHEPPNLAAKLVWRDINPFEVKERREDAKRWANSIFREFKSWTANNST